MLVRRFVAREVTMLYDSPSLPFMPLPFLLAAWVSGRVRDRKTGTVGPREHQDGLGGVVWVWLVIAM